MRPAIWLTSAGASPKRKAPYEWLRGKQHFSGAWHAYYQGDDVMEHTLDTNVTCYIANGVWHHDLATGDTGFLTSSSPTSSAVIDFALDNQRPSNGMPTRAASKARARS